MGLDSVELLVEIEKTFDINIPDAQASKISTVGDFHDVVWKYIDNKNASICHSRALFYRLRPQFVEILNISRADFLPSSTLESVIPLTNRRKIWDTLEHKTMLKFPALVLPEPLSNILTITSVILTLGGLIASLVLVLYFSYPVTILVFPAIILLTASLISKMLNPKRIVFSENNINDFINQLLVLNSKELHEAGVNRKEMELLINYIISEKSGIDLSEISSEKRIHHDLGID